MTSVVQTGRDLGLSKGQNRTVFRNPRGLKRYYSFYKLNGSAVVGASIFVEYSTDGVTWTNSPTTVISFQGESVESVCHAFDVKIHDDGSQLEVWVAATGYGYTAQAHQTKYMYGTIADSASAISWSAEQTIDAAIVDDGMDEPHCIALARTDNGEIVVAFTEDMHDKCKSYRLTKLIGSDGDGASPSWSGETIWDDASASSNNQGKDEIWFGLENFNSSYPDKCLLYARLPEDFGPTFYRIATAAPEWDNDLSVFTNTAQSPNLAGAGVSNGVITGLIDEDDKAHVAYMRGSNSVKHNRANSAGDDNWGGAYNILSVNVNAITITLDTGPATDLLYVFYRKTADSVDWSYKTSPASGTISFGSEKIVSYHEEVSALSSWSRDVEDSLHVGGVVYILADVTIYNEHPVYRALSTTLADLEFPDQNYYLGPHST